MNISTLDKSFAMQMSRDELLRAYRTMIEIRAFDERIEKDFAAGKIPGFGHVYLGAEAIAAGACHDLAADDYIASTHRGHGHCIAKGCDLEGMMLEIFGKAGGICGGKGGSMHIADFDKGMLGANAIVGGSPPIVVGAALNQKIRKTGKVAVAFAGDGASNQGTTFEAMNMAVVLQVPAIFVIENNGFGEHTASSYSVGAESIAARAAAFGMPAEQIDGVDFFAVRESMLKALERARTGGGPTTIEMKVPRYLGHYIGDPQAYRTPAELKAARAIDPLVTFREKVVSAGLLDAETFAVIDLETYARVEAAAEKALEAPYPDPSALERDVYISY
ncbi:thiamine pyrophosphate-dependent dehydrogenase E1 component subunit alpha [Aquisediminimonas sediminicola]|uniref:thiamine pyrophosphate-dependent dehydrogenase E1 component subunit alpha n=1 Tax=Alteraquisediminimonas sediminicola TaxID=2676787 RepID=UPI001FE2DA3B|nr:thiamine pyrophosphate-dependent dehydrogenase E1 component subunit alpha [Aquisediminimonas sediminicola]